MKKLILGIIVYLIAVVTLMINTPVGLIYTIGVAILRKEREDEPTLSEYFWDSAVSLDQAQNTLVQHPLNDFMIRPSGIKYGNPDETVSGVTGKNQRIDKLSWFGKRVNAFLSFLEKDHSLKSIEDDEI